VRPALAATALLLTACTGAISSMPDASQPAEDSGSQDSGTPPDAGQMMDSGTTEDAGPTDAGPMDSGTPDAGPTDAGTMDAGSGTLIAVVVGYGARRVSSTDGVHWNNFVELTPNGGDDDNLFRGVGYGAGTFVAVGGSSKGFTMTSTDGIHWSNENRTSSAWIGNAGYLNGTFIAAGGNGLRTRSLDLGKTWVDEAGYQSVHYRDLVVGNALAGAAGHSYASVGVITSTPDGLTWTERLNGGAAFNHIVFGNGVFVAAGDTGRVAWSADAITWTDVSPGAANGVSLSFTGTEFLVSVTAGVYRSTDGAAWTQTTATRGADAYFLGHWLSFGWPATIDASTDGTQWTNVFNPQGSGLTRLAQGLIYP
jgi:hypothetical protein